MTATHKPPTKPKKAKTQGRISTKMRAVVTLMANEGIDITTAAQRVGMHPGSAQRAIKQNHVKRLYHQMVSEIMENAAQAAYLRNNYLAKTAESQRLQYDANRWVAGVAGISPIAKVEGRHQHNVTFGGFTFDDPGLVDVTPEDTKSPDDGE